MKRRQCRDAHTTHLRAWEHDAVARIEADFQRRPTPT
jgi:hypothetical protein